MFRPSLMTSAVLAAALGLAACGGGGSSTSSPELVNVTVGDTVALTASGHLLSFNRITPGTQVGSVAVVGLIGNETLLGIDVRPADNTLYGVGSIGNIYKLNPANGQATFVSTLRAAAGDDRPLTALSGTTFGVDFNPVADRLRVVSNTGQNLRINVDTGDATTDGVITPAGAAVSASAYTNSFAGTGSTRLFSLNSATHTLDLQDPPNNGTQVAGPPLGVASAAVNGFDIDARNNTGYAALTVGASTALYRINLSAAAPAAAATLIGAIAGGETIRGLALVQPAAASITGLTTANRLVGIDPRAPTTLTRNVAITGLTAGDIILGMDFRPADGQLWALSNTGRLYTLDAATGAAILRSTLAADPADLTAPFTGLDGSTALSVDFNPAADRLRVLSPAGQSLRINVATGATTTDGNVNRVPGPASVIAAAYTNSFAGTTATTLYDLDANSDVLAVQNPPNDGTLVNVGALGVDITGLAALDIAGGENGLALAALRPGAAGPFELRSVTLATGASALYLNTSGNAALSQIGGASGPELRDIAISLP
ncbi:MAG: polymerase [Polaromonas sp.]|nr:polymerase [Polaromonas sp.]